GWFVVLGDAALSSLDGMVSTSPGTTFKELANLPGLACTMASRVTPKCCAMLSSEASLRCTRYCCGCEEGAGDGLGGTVVLLETSKSRGIICAAFGKSGGRTLLERKRADLGIRDNPKMRMPWAPHRSPPPTFHLYRGG